MGGNEVPFVLDTSVTMTWCFEDEATDPTDELLGRLVEEGAVAPGVWPLEVTNVLLVAERRRRITEAQSARFLTLLASLPIDVDIDQTQMGVIAGIGRRHTLSSYDASYVALAERRGLGLATLDQNLRAAAAEAGIELVLRG